MRTGATIAGRISDWAFTCASCGFRVAELREREDYFADYMKPPKLGVPDAAIEMHLREHSPFDTAKEIRIMRDIAGEVRAIARW